MSRWNQQQREANNKPAKMKGGSHLRQAKGAKPNNNDHTLTLKKDMKVPHTVLRQKNHKYRGKKFTKSTKVLAARKMDWKQPSASSERIQTKCPARNIFSSSVSWISRKLAITHTKRLKKKACDQGGNREHSNYGYQTGTERTRIPLRNHIKNGVKKAWIQRKKQDLLVNVSKSNRTSTNSGT